MHHSTGTAPRLTLDGTEAHLHFTEPFTLEGTTASGQPLWIELEIPDLYLPVRSCPNTQTAATVDLGLDLVIDLAEDSVGPSESVDIFPGAPMYDELLDLVIANASVCLPSKM